MPLPADAKWQILFPSANDRTLVSCPEAQVKAIRGDGPENQTPTFQQFDEKIRSFRSQKFNGRGADESAVVLPFTDLVGVGQAEASGLPRGDVHVESEQI